MKQRKERVLYFSDMLQIAFFDKSRPSNELKGLVRARIPTGEIEAGNAVHKKFEDNDILERSRIVSLSTARMPYIGLQGHYNKKWFVDAITLPHNSVRRMLSHLFSMTFAVQRLALDMTESDFAKLFAFISHMHCYVRTLLEAEEVILYSLLERKLCKMSDYNPEHALYPVKRGLMKRRIVDLLIDVCNIENGHVPSTEIAVTVQNKVDKFAGLLLDYFVQKEKLLPKLIESSIFGSRERTRLERRLIKFFARLGDEYYFTAILVAPLKNMEVREAFIKTHFPSTKSKALFHIAVREVEDVLFGVAEAFDRAAQKYSKRFSVEEFMSMYGTETDIHDEFGLLEIDEDFI